MKNALWSLFVLNFLLVLMAGCTANKSASTPAAATASTSELSDCALGIALPAACKASSGSYVSAAAGANVSGVAGALTASIPAGYYTGTQSCTMSDADLVAANILSGVDVFGVTGSAGVNTLLTSSVHHDVGSAPGKISEEYSNYATAAANYRAIPVIAKDDDGYDATSPVQKVVRGVAVWNGAVPRRVCGKGGATVAAKIQDCYDQHAGDLPSWNAGVANKIQWNGEAKGNAGQGRWTLVTIYSASLGNGVACDATCFEVWQDERTKLIWSDRLAGANTNWCNASGNTENRDGINCTAGGIGGQSWCTDDALHVAYKGNTLAAENVKWRLPTIYDWKLADVNGIRIVLPNMANWFWSASVFSLTRGLAWFFDGLYGYVDVGPRVSDDSVRCLGVVGP